MKRILPALIALFLFSLACTLTSEAPATLAPVTPMSTITPDAVLVPPTLQADPFQVEEPSGVVENNTSDIIPSSNVATVSGDRMLRDINTMVAFETRHILSDASPTRGIDAAKNWLIQELKNIASANPNPEIQIDVFPHTFQMEFADQTVYPSNVVMVINGTDASAGVVMVTAHYDTALSNWTLGNAYQPGANDNASGVAAILEMARILVQQPHRATLVFVMFAAEETGRQGSIAFVNDFIRTRNLPLIATLNLDIIGNPVGRRGERYDNMMRVFSEAPNHTSPSRQLARMIQVAVSQNVPGMTLEVQDRQERAGRWGDHMSFNDAGYPAVRLIEAADDPTIAHTTSDTVDRIDINYLVRTTQVALAAIEMLADGPNPPTLRPLRQSENNPENQVLEWSFDAVCQSYLVAFRRPDAVTYDPAHFYTVQQTTSLSWNGFANFESVTVACIDRQGRLGRFAPELVINPPQQVGQ
jgi:hypothetical protein